MKTSRAISLGVLIGLVVGLTLPLTCWRYRIETANMGESGLHVPVFVKFDRFTGAAWISAGQGNQWRKFAESPAFTPPPLSSEEKPVRDVAGN